MAEEAEKERSSGKVGKTPEEGVFMSLRPPVIEISVYHVISKWTSLVNDLLPSHGLMPAIWKGFVTI